MFDQLTALPADPLLGLITAFKNDPNSTKVDLGVGVYRDETGHTPIMSAIKKAGELQPTATFKLKSDNNGKARLDLKLSRHSMKLIEIDVK